MASGLFQGYYVLTKEQLTELFAKGKIETAEFGTINYSDYAMYLTNDSQEDINALLNKLISDNSSKINEIEVTINDLSLKITKNKEDVDSLNLVVTKINSDIIDMNSKISKNTSDIQAINTLIEQGVGAKIYVKGVEVNEWNADTKADVSSLNDISLTVDNLQNSVSSITDTITLEQVTLNTWENLIDKNIYKFKSTVAINTTIKNNDIVELFNDNPVLFSTYGFVIGEINGQNITFYAIEQPTTSCILTLCIGASLFYKETETKTVDLWKGINDPTTTYPYSFESTITLNTDTTGKIISLINDNPEDFSLFGFAINKVDGQNITLYSMSKPLAPITFTFIIEGGIR